MYQGTLIEELMQAVERAETSARKLPEVKMFVWEFSPSVSLSAQLSAEAVESKAVQAGMAGVA